MYCNQKNCPDNLFQECTYTNFILHYNNLVPCKYEEKEHFLYKDEDEGEKEVTIPLEEYNTLTEAAKLLEQYLESREL